MTLNNNEINVIPLFSQPVGIFKLNVDHEKIHTFLKNKIKYKNLSINHKFSSLISVENKLFNLYKELKELKKECEKSLDIYLKDILKYDFKFKILNSWGTKASPNCYSHLHSHKHNLLSAVYYPSYSENFKIAFEKNEGIDTFFKIEPKEYTVLNSSVWTIVPELGTLLIFPSTLKHRILPNNGKEDRYSLAFCVNPTGKFEVGNDNEIEFI